MDELDELLPSQAGGDELDALLPSGTKEIPIVPERGPIPELRQGNPRWKQNIHDVAAGTLPWTGLGLGAAVVSPSLVTPVGIATELAAGGTGYALGKKGVTLLDKLVGYREPHPMTPETPGRAMLRTTGDILEGAKQTGYGVATAGVLGSAAQATGTYLAKRGTKGVNEGAIRSEVARGFKKGVRELISGKRTYTQRRIATDRQVSAVQSIIRNKENLVFTDDAGNAVKGRLPQNLDELSQAADQLEGQVFQKYDAMQRAAGGQGFAVDLRPYAAELKALSEDPVMLNHAPLAAKEAAIQAEMLATQGLYTPGEAQKAIAVLNGQLKGFYKTPDVNQASKAYVDSIVVARLRNGLDKAVEAAEGPGYQALKNEWGALRSIRPEVNQRAVVSGRAAPVSFQKFIENVATAAELAAAAKTGGASNLAKAAAIKTMGVVMRRSNDPNRIVSKMFTNVEKQLAKGQQTTLAQKVAGRIAADRAARASAAAQEQAAWDEARGLGVSPYDEPTFQRRGILIPQEAPEAVLNRLPRTPSMPTVEERAQVFMEKQPIGAEASMDTFFPPEAPPWGALPEWRTPEGRAAINLERMAQEPKFPTELVEKMGGAGEIDPYWSQAPAWMRSERSTTISPNAYPPPPPPQAPPGAGPIGRIGRGARAPSGPTEAQIGAMVRERMPPGTPEWMIQEQIQMALGRTKPVTIRRTPRAPGPAGSAFGRRIAPDEKVNAITERQVVGLVANGKGAEAAKHVKEGIAAGKITLQEAEDSIINDAMGVVAEAKKKGGTVAEGVAQRAAQGMEGLREGLAPNSIKKKLEDAGYFGTLDRLHRGIITEEEAILELSGKLLPTPTEIKILDPYQFASKMVSEGVDRKTSWSMWIKYKNLSPGMDAKDWFKIFDKVKGLK